MQEEKTGEEWEDTIKSFVPAFAGVTVKTIGDRSLDAHLVIDKNDDLAVRIMDAHETVTFTFGLRDMFEFEVAQFTIESWELYFGLLETKRQLMGIVAEFDKRLQEATDIMNLRDDKPPVE